MVKFNFLDRFVGRFKKKRNVEQPGEKLDGKLSNLSRRFNVWRRKSASRLSFLLRSRKNKTKVPSSTKQRRAARPKDRPRKLSRLSILSLLGNRRKRARQPEQTASASNISTRPSAPGTHDEEEIGISSDTLQLSNSSSTISCLSSSSSECDSDGSGIDSSSDDGSSVVDEVVCAEEACECVDKEVEMETGEMMVKNFEASNMGDATGAKCASCVLVMDKLIEHDVKEVISQQPEEKPPPRVHLGDDEGLVADQDLFIIVASFIITVFVTGFIMTVVF